MEKILNQILAEIQEMKANQVNIDRKVDSLIYKANIHEKSNKLEFVELSGKIDSIIDAVAKDMEDITELKEKNIIKNIEIAV
jgi:hypothetical protein